MKTNVSNLLIEVDSNELFGLFAALLLLKMPFDHFAMRFVHAAAEILHFSTDNMLKIIPKSFIRRKIHKYVVHSEVNTREKNSNLK